MCVLCVGELFSEECVHSEKFMLSDLPDYYIGEEGDLKHYKEVRSCSSACSDCLVDLTYVLYCVVVTAKIDDSWNACH